MTMVFARIAPVLLVAWPAAVAAQSGASPLEPPATLLTAACSCVVIPALTPVSIEILSTLGSKLSKSGDTFAIRLAAPVVIDGRQVVPAGVTGMGEVAHAKKSGGSGAGGELILAARYLEAGGRRLKLRSMRIVQVGKDQTMLVFATSQAIGPFSLAIQGRNIEVPAGTTAEARTAEAFSWDQPSPDAPPAAVSSSPAVSSDSHGETKNEVH